MYTRFGLVLMVNHICNLRCDYCYGGAKADRPMPRAVGEKAIDRAVNSLAPGGTLELGFFGGEPLLEPDLVSGLIAYARRAAGSVGAQFVLGLTTNGTMVNSATWALMMTPDLRLAISHDGLPEVHDRHRRFADGHPSSSRVLETMRMLMTNGRAFNVVMVVRPDTLDALPDGIRFLHGFGVKHLEASLDLWATWTRADLQRLPDVIERCAWVWRDGLPERGVSWFDEKAALITRTQLQPTARCGFGDGEVAVAPSGHLYPCERLIGEDREDNPMRLPGSVADSADFHFPAPPPCPIANACAQCRMRAYCNVTCRCGNYVRTGDCGRPDALLCAVNRATFRAAARVLQSMVVTQPPAPDDRRERRRQAVNAGVREDKEMVAAWEKAHVHDN